MTRYNELAELISAAPACRYDIEKVELDAQDAQEVEQALRQAQTEIDALQGKVAKGQQLLREEMARANRYAELAAKN